METKITAELLTYISSDNHLVTNKVVDYILEQSFAWAELGAKTYYFKAANDLCGGDLYNKEAYKEVKKILKQEYGIDANLTNNGIIVAWE